MAEPQPPNIHEGATTAADEPEAPSTAGGSGGAEGRKAAAALSALDSRGGDDEKAKTPSAADQQALGEAMSRLEIIDKARKMGAAGDGGKEGKKEEVEVRKKVKVAAEDVGLLVEELELTKNKATELLKAHEGDAVKAIRAYIKAAA